MIISTTLTGNSADIIGDALDSLVYWVDACLVIDTGVTDSTIHVAREVVGDKLILRRWPWRHDFSAARNAALDFARGIGARWAWTLDPDERMLFKPEFTLRELETNGDLWVLFTNYADQSYAKERLIRLDSPVRWHGVTHECVETIPDEHRALTLNLGFTELEKTPHQKWQKNTRDLALLLDYTGAHPEEPRWWVYLGSTLTHLKRYEEALEPLRECVKLTGVENEGSMAVFRLLQCYGHLKRWEDAIRLCDLVLLQRPSDEGFQQFIEVARGKLVEETKRAGLPSPG